jgi:hypothetical protein
MKHKEVKFEEIYVSHTFLSFVFLKNMEIKTKSPFLEILV